MWTVATCGSRLNAVTCRNMPPASDRAATNPPDDESMLTSVVSVETPVSRRNARLGPSSLPFGVCPIRMTLGFACSRTAIAAGTNVSLR